MLLSVFPGCWWETLHLSAWIISPTTHQSRQVSRIDGRLWLRAECGVGRGQVGADWVRNGADSVVVVAAES